MLEEQDKHGLPQLPPLPATRPPTAAAGADDAATTPPAAAAAAETDSLSVVGESAAGSEPDLAAGPAISAEDAPHVGRPALAGSDEEGDVAVVLASGRLLTPSAAGAATSLSREAHLGCGSR
jgi:hypothetical protein